MSSVRFAPTTAEKKTAHFRFPSITSCTSSSSNSAGQLYQEPIIRPRSTQPHSSHHHQQQQQPAQPPIRRVSHHHHHPTSDRPPSISKVPTTQLQPARHPHPAAVRPRTQSLTLHQGTTGPTQDPRHLLLPTTTTNSHSHLAATSRTPSPASSSSPSRPSIAHLKKSLVDTIHAFSCPLEDKLTLVAKLHAEVEAELTHLNGRHNAPLAADRTLPLPAYHGHSRKEIEDTIRLIQHADRIKAQALQQLKLDISLSNAASHQHHHSHHHHHHHQQQQQQMLPHHSHAATQLALTSRDLL